MRVLLIYEQDSIDGFGGTATYLRRIVDGLLQSGNSVFLTYPKYTGEIEHYLQGAKLLPIEIKRDSYRKNVNHFATILNNRVQTMIVDHGIDVVHLIFGWYLFHYFDFSKVFKLGKKAFVTVHNVPPQECRKTFAGDSYIRRLTGVLYESFQVMQSFCFIHRIDKKVKIIVPCNNVKKRLKKYFSSNPIMVIHHGYDNSFLPDTVEDNACDSKKCKILTVAGIAPGKNLNLLIDIASKLQNKNKYHFTIVGSIRDQKYYNYLQKKIKKKGLDSNFCFSIDCSNDDLIRLYKESTLYVQPSRDEGFCLAALDAAAIGLRVIGSDIGEIGSIAKLSGGREIKYNDTDGYCRAIEELTKDQTCLFAKRANVIRSKYNWAATTKQLVAYYNEK